MSIGRSLRAAIDPHTFDDNVAKTKTLMAAVQMKAGALLAERNERIETVSNSKGISLDSEKIAEYATDIHSQNKNLEDELKRKIFSRHIATRGELQYCPLLTLSCRGQVAKFGSPRATMPLVSPWQQ